MTDMIRMNFKKRAVAVAVASCLSLAPWLAEAASLGKITVLSGLGQPLRAEIELNASRAELAGMSARLAPSTAFREAGIDYAPVLLDLRFAVDKRANGTPVVKVSSPKPVYEPFIDVLVELSWPAGPLLREYTFLLDPPEVAAKAAARQAATADARVVETSRGAGAATTGNGAAVSGAPVTSPRAALQPGKEQASGTHLVEKGETLRKIAGETKYEGVTLEQMLVGLFRKNPGAFVGENINRMKAGAILAIPDKAAVAAIPAAEAKQIYVSQTGDWNAYRQKLAAATAQAKPAPDHAAQSSTGKITAKVDEKPSAVDLAKDQVKVSPTEKGAKAGAGEKAGRSEEESFAKEQALKEAEARVALLEKNVSELQKLVDMKTQLLAELQQKAAARKEEPAPPVAPAVQPKAPEPVPAPPVVAVEPPKPVEPPKVVEEAKPTPPVVPPAPPEVKKPEAPAKPVAVPAPVGESSFVDQLLEDPLPLIGGGGVLALLAGYFLLRRRQSEPEPELAGAAPAPSSLGPNSVFRMTGGQSVDTGNVPLPTGEFSQMGLASIDTDEVDPVAEADVYMAYGRDAQAEEILIEALRKDPQRTAIHVKLFEIYAKNRSVKQFDTLASEFYAQTGGLGAEWEKVAAMGAALDPENPLYSDGRDATSQFAGQPGVTGGTNSAATSSVGLGQFSAATVAAMGAALESGEQPVTVMPSAVQAESFVGSAESVLDIDLGGAGQPFAAEAEASAELAGEMAMPAMEVIDFDLSSVPAESPNTPETNPQPVNEERDFTETLVAFGGPEGFNDVAPAADAVDFDLSGAAAGREGAADLAVDIEFGDAQPPATGSESFAVEPAIQAPEFDLSSINLDLGAGLAEPVQPDAQPAPGSPQGGANEPGGEDVGTKLALAKAYEEMGDEDQARELLQEVIAEGGGDLAAEARNILARLGG